MSNVSTNPAALPRPVLALHALAVGIGFLLIILYAFAVPQYVMLDRHLLYAAFMATGVVVFGINAIYPAAVGNTWEGLPATVLAKWLPLSTRQLNALIALLALGVTLYSIFAAYD